MKYLYKFCWDYRRDGVVEGLFIAEETDVENLIGKNVYFGEILGKHSEVFGTIDKEDFEIISNDQELCDKLSRLTGGTLSGYNPFEYIEEDYEDE